MPAGTLVQSKKSKTKTRQTKKLKYIYFFGNGRAEGTKDQKSLLGGKGANLAEMTRLGIPVPPGFTISTEACREYYRKNGQYPEGLEAEIQVNLRKLEESTVKGFGDSKNPLLVSVRSGAAVSMPGMMDTILNLGLNEQTVHGLIAKTKNERFVYDAYRRFIQMFSNVVLGVEHSHFEHLLHKKKEQYGVKLDTELNAKALSELVKDYKALVVKEVKKEFPSKPQDQLKMACEAVFGSWNNNRAVIYRNLHGLSHEGGTAVNVQAMVFGNMGDDSGTGVAFTRNPNTGEKRFFGEYLMNAQGEDVVAGIRTPLSIDNLKKKLPHIYSQLEDIYQRLERHYKDMQDLEFTIESNRLYLLQTRNGKRTAAAAVRIAYELVQEGLITKDQALLRVDANSLNQLLHPMLDPAGKYRAIAKGLPASPGAAMGKVYFNAEEAIKAAQDHGEKVILVRDETSPEDVGGMAASQGILTARGGMTSHAAVVGRGMGKCCVVGCGQLRIDEDKGTFQAGDVVVKRGDWVTLNGTTGEVILGETELIEPQFGKEFKELMKWADEARFLKIRTNADTPEDAKAARRFGAEGIGLCRTEHMFFAEDRLLAMREMILAETVDDRKAALRKLEPSQKQDFKEIFRAMKGLPVTIRLLDPPLHEFLPKGEREMELVAKDLKISVKELQAKVANLHELNPMLGHRGCRLAVTYPEIYEMQTEAIFEAACELKKEGLNVVPEVMVPLVGIFGELQLIKKNIIRVAEEVIKQSKVKLDYLIGTMIEVPRAAIIADEIAHEADFFSFGTNDLTQLTFGFSRDDIAKFLPAYLKQGLLQTDPFVSIDQGGLGKLMAIAVEKGRSVKPKLKVGICGEHGGEPHSIAFCHQLKFDYVSCSPYRVPVARLAAAQAVLKQKISR